MAAYRRVDDLKSHLRADCLTPGSAPGPTLGIEYGMTFTFSGHYAVQGHSMSPIWVPMTSY